MGTNLYINGKEVKNPAAKAVLAPLVLIFIIALLSILLLILLPLGIVLAIAALSIGGGTLYLRHKLRKLLTRTTSGSAGVNEAKENIQEARVIESRPKDGREASRNRDG